jgi:tetratricopeptide (TPR) repeat protein
MSGEQYLKAAYAYLYIHEFERAREAFQQAIACDPENPTYYFRASVTAHRSGQLQLAKQWATQAIERNPYLALYQQHLASVESSLAVLRAKEAQAQNQKSEAFGALEEALAYDPLNTEAFQIKERWTTDWDEFQEL